MPEADNEKQPQDNPSDKLRELMLMTGNEESPVMLPFEGFRERLQAEEKASSDLSTLNEKEKKSLAGVNSKHDPDIGFNDEERSSAHFRKAKMKIPHTAQIITGNKYTPLDEEVLSNAYKNYKQRFVDKTFPFEYEDAADITEPRIYIDEDRLEEFPGDIGSGESDSYNFKSKIHSRFLDFICYV